MSTLVLVVEDDPSVAALERAILEVEGYDVIVAKDGLEGLVKLEFEHPAVVILDVMMPDVDGARVLSEMLAQPNLAGVPVIVVTGAANAHQRFDTIVGRENVLVKPFEPAALIARVEALTEGGTSGKA
jgi:DNA-binding response OmpR family regulator